MRPFHVSVKPRFRLSTAKIGTNALSASIPSSRAAMLAGDMELSRIAWLTTVGICAIAAVLLLLSDYFGYAGLLTAVGLSAAINLR